VIELDLVKFNFVIKSHDIDVLRSSKLDILRVFNRVGIDDSVGGDVEISDFDDFSFAGAIERATENCKSLEDHLVRATFDSIERFNSGEVSLPLLELFKDFTKVDNIEGIIIFVLFKVVVDDVIFGVFFFGEEFDLVFTYKFGEFTKGCKISGDFSFGSISANSDGGHVGMLICNRRHR